MIDATKKLMVVSSNIDTVDKRSARFQQESEFLTVGEIITAGGWKSYKAFITQTGTDEPVVQVLNANDPDYLGAITWAFDTDHIDGTLSGTWGAFVVPKPALLDGSWVVPTISGNNGIVIAGSDFAKTYIEILQKVTGEAPVLLGATTNGCGTAISLIFDKDMSAQGVYDAWVTNSDITVSGGSGSGVASNVSISGSIVTLLFDDRYALYEDDVTITVAASTLMTTEYGYYAGVTGGAVTNAITAASPTVTSSVVPANGLSIICTFSKAMALPSCADGFTYTIDASPYTVGSIIRGSAANILILTDLEETIRVGDTVTLERDATAIIACGIISSDGGCLGAVTAGAVTNDSAVPQP